MPRTALSRPGQAEYTYADAAHLRSHQSRIQGTGEPPLRPTEALPADSRADPLGNRRRSGPFRAAVASAAPGRRLARRARHAGLHRPRERLGPGAGRALAAGDPLARAPVGDRVHERALLRAAGIVGGI